MTTTEEKKEYCWERHGDEFSFVWQSAGIGISVDQVHEARDELYAEVWVRSSLPDQPPHVHWGRLNLSSVSAREKLATTLKARINLPWSKMLESVCTRTAIEFRRGEPFVDLATLGPPPPLKYLVSKLLPAKSLTVVFGDGGSCKSLLALALGIAVRTDCVLPNGLRANELGEVAYLDWETCHEDQQERIRALTLGLGLDDLPHIHYRRQTRNITDDIGQLRVQIARMGAKLVIVDSLGPAVGGSLRDEQEAIPAMNAINSLGVTALALAHITKADARNENAKATPLGSVFFSNLARSTWEVRKSEGGTEDIVSIGLYHRKSNRGPLLREPLGFTFRFYNQEDYTEMIEVTGCDVAGDDDLAQHAPLAYRLRSMLRSGGRGIDELTEATGAKKDTVRRTLLRMRDAQCIAGSKGRNGVSVWGLRAHEAS